MEGLDSSALSMVVAVVIPILLLLAASSRSNTQSIHLPSESAVLITGGSRGIGRATAEHLLSLGFHVFVTVRKQSQYDDLEKKKKIDSGGPQLHPVIMDVTKDDHVAPALKRVKSQMEDNNIKLVAIVNNAAINPEGSVLAKAYDDNDDTQQPTELADPSTVGLSIFETNVLGVARTTRAFLPLLCNDGRVINVGSYFGSIAGAIGIGHAYYESSKFALEGMTNNMRRSLKKEGKWACLIKPGNIITDMNRAAGEVPASVVAKDIEHAITSTKPRPRYYPGTVKGMPTRLVCFIFDMLPTSFTDNL